MALLTDSGLRCQYRDCFDKTIHLNEPYITTAPDFHLHQRCMFEIRKDAERIHNHESQEKEIWER